MARDWDCEWAALSDAERAAFAEKVETTAALTRIFAAYGAPDMAKIDAAEGAEKRWLSAKAACTRFIAEFRAS